VKTDANAALPASADKAQVVEDMFDRIAPRYDLLNRLLTFRMDVGWRRTAVRELELAPGSVVLDVACGTGDLCRELGKSGLRPIGVDFSAGMLAERSGCAPLVRGGVAAAVPDWLDRRPDLGLRCAASPASNRSSRRVARAAPRDASFLDVAEPASPQVRPARVVVSQVVPFVGGLVSDRRAYAYLPARRRTFPARGARADARARLRQRFPTDTRVRRPNCSRDPSMTTSLSPDARPQFWRTAADRRPRRPRAPRAGGFAWLDGRPDS
jgi:demethylmenaquinone methyltransferase/2-methoxy-6-polyprenyl-1,4-benzoquinol methylase